MQKFAAVALSTIVLATACGAEDTVENNGSNPGAPSDQEPTPSDPGSSAPSQSESDAETSSKYTDGTYSATGTYTSPAGEESISVELTLKDDVVTDVTVEALATDPTSLDLQELFIEGIDAEVLGLPLDDIELKSAVNGASLTPEGFMDALDSIKESALDE